MTTMQHELGKGSGRKKTNKQKKLYMCLFQTDQENHHLKTFKWDKSTAISYRPVKTVPLRILQANSKSKENKPQTIQSLFKGLSLKHVSGNLEQSDLYCSKSLIPNHKKKLLIHPRKLYGEHSSVSECPASHLHN